MRWDQSVKIRSPRTGSGGGWGDRNCALAIEHKTHDGASFTAIYGHLLCDSLPAVKEVYAGRPIGKVGYWSDGDHVHFGIHPGPFSTIAASHWGRQYVSGNWTDPCVGSCLNSMTDPIAYIRSNYAYAPTTEVQTFRIGDVAWTPKDVSCETATSWYRLTNPPRKSQSRGV
jgi:hypothetical protein